MWRDFAAFMLLGRGPNCAARHPEQRRVRCEIAPHGGEHLHQGSGLLWNEVGPVRRPPRPGPDYVHPYRHRGGLYLVREETQ